MKYKKGDYVKIKNIAVGETACGYIFIKSMEQYCGTVSKIIAVQTWIIRLECTGMKTGWSPDWIKPWVKPDYLPDKLFEI